MSLISVMVAAMLSVVVALAVGTIMKNSNKGIKGVRGRGDYEDMKSVVRLLSYQDTQCDGAFLAAGGSPIEYKNAPVDFDKIRIGSTDLLAVQAPGSTNGSAVRLTRLQLLPFSGTGSGTASAGNHPVRLQIDAEIVGDSFGARKLQESVPMLISTDASGGITSCDGQSVTNPVQEMCEQLGLPFDETAGNCGVTVPPKDCAAEGKIVTGVAQTGEILCGVPTTASSGGGSGGSSGGCVQFVNKKCFNVDKSVDGGRGWRRAGNQVYLNDGAYCSTTRASCWGNGSQVSDVDTTESLTPLEYCSQRYGPNYTPASMRGKCKTWTTENKRSRQISCTCAP